MGNKVQIAFRVDEELRNKFASKVKGRGLDGIDVLRAFVEDYVAGTAGTGIKDSPKPSEELRQLRDVAHNALAGLQSEIDRIPARHQPAIVMALEGLARAIGEALSKEDLIAARIAETAEANRAKNRRNVSRERAGEGSTDTPPAEPAGRGPSGRKI